MRGATMLLVHARVLPLVAIVVLSGCGDGGSGDQSNPASELDLDCHVRVSMTEGELLSVAQGTVDYAGAPGHFVGAFAATECVRLDDRVSVQAANQCTGKNGTCRGDERPELLIQMQTANTLSAPLDLLDCRFAASAVPTLEDFEVVGVFASDPSLQPTTPPTIAVTSVDCDASASTTTLPPAGPCDGIECESNEVCIDGDCVVTDHYLVEFQTDLAATYGAIDFNVRYDCVDGSFDGDTTGVACTLTPSLNLFGVVNDLGCSLVEGETYVAVAAVSAFGWAGPGPLMACEYTSATDQPPTVASLRVEMEDAATPAGRPLTRATVSVSAIRPLPPSM